MRSLVICVCLVCLLVLPPYVLGNTRDVASCGIADVQAAVDGAAAGDILLVPAGDCVWTVRLVVSKAIVLSGAGVGRTIIRDGVQSGPLISWVAEEGLHRLTGFEFRDGGRTAQNFNGIISIDATVGRSTVRVDHNRFDHLNGVHLRPNDVIGVVDHNEFFTSPTRIPIYMYNRAWTGGGIYGDSSWHEPVEWGGDEFLFVEDNLIVYDAGTSYVCNDGFRGTRAVLRFNTVIGCNFEVHGTESSGRNRGSRAIEVYQNQVSNDRGQIINIRSGSALVWGNSADISSTAVVARLDNFRTIAYFPAFGAADGMSQWDINTSVSPAFAGTISAAGPLTATVAGAGWKSNEWVGYSVRRPAGCTASIRNCHSIVVANTEDTVQFAGSAGFASGLAFSSGELIELRKLTATLDQPGRGGGGLIEGETAVKPAGWNDQADFPIYEWENTNRGEDIDIYASISCSSCVENQHFYNSNAAFDGSAGVGVGIAAARPETCTPGVWYWAIDEGEWWRGNSGPDGRAYTCESGEWLPGYTPYTYPHPLVSGEDTVPPTVVLTLP